MKYFLFSFTVTLSFLSFAQEPVELSEFFMVYPGKPAPDYWNDEGSSVPGTRISSRHIPITPEPLSTVFHDAHVWMLGEDRIIVGLRAERTFSNTEQCEAALATAAQAFEASLNLQTPSTPIEIKFLSSDSNVIAQLACRGTQFPRLSLTFEHPELGQEMQNEFGR